MSITIEEETGTYTGPIHLHNGYCAGSFTTPSESSVLDRCFAWGRSQSVPQSPAQRMSAAAHQLTRLATDFSVNPSDLSAMNSINPCGGGE